MGPTLLARGSISGVDEIAIEYIIKIIKKHMNEFGYNRADLSDRIWIIQAKTGSGKSTVIPVELFRILRNKDTPVVNVYSGASVLCTQPRILTAIELAKNVNNINSPWNPDMIMGKTVGYQTGPFTNKPPKGLVYATLGVLTVQLNNHTVPF